MSKRGTVAVPRAVTRVALEPECSQGLHKDLLNKLCRNKMHQACQSSMIIQISVSLDTDYSFGKLVLKATA